MVGLKDDPLGDAVKAALSEAINNDVAQKQRDHKTSILVGSAIGRYVAFALVSLVVAFGATTGYYLDRL